MPGNPWDNDPIVQPKSAAPVPWEADPIVTPAPRQPAAPLMPTGTAHDGDTFATAGGPNARLLGVDAFELNQTGRAPGGSIVPLGQQARARALPFYQPGATVTPTGEATYGRPVVTVDRGGDAGAALLHDGLALAEPKYLGGDVQRMMDYVQLERLARLNRRGAHADTYQTPSAFRHGDVDPVTNPVEAQQGQSNTAIFWDDPTPFAGLPKGVADGYISVWQDPKSTPGDLLAYAKANGFQLDPSNVRQQYAARAKSNRPGSEITYQNTPRVLTDMKDGAFGAGLRGFADPFNVLDEAGALVDSLVPGSERENVWRSDRRFGDVYANNLEQNRSILGYDDATHPWARFGGQLAGGLVVPGASVEGVGFNAARAAMRGGASRMAAEAAARQAVVGRLATAGAVEGAVAGGGAGEGWQDRATGAIIGAPAGAVLGGLTGVAAPKLAAMVGRPFSKLVGREGEESAQAFTDGALDAGKAGAQNSVGAAAPVDAPSAAARAVEDVAPSAPPRGRPGALRGSEYVERFAQPYSVKDYIEQPQADRLGSAVIGPDGKLHAFRTNGSEIGHADEVGHYDFRHAIGPDESSAYGEVTRFRGEIAVTRPANPTPQQEAAFNQLVARAKREGLGVVEENPKPAITETDRADFATYQREWDAARQSGAGDASFAPWADDPIVEPASAQMAAEPDPAIYGPDMGAPRTVDRIDVNAQRARRLLDGVTDAERLAQAGRMRPGDVLPLPSNTVDGLDEFSRISAGRYDPVRAPNERDVLEARGIPSPRDGTRTIPKRGPLDLVTWLRTQGGIRNSGGVLQHLGIDNTPRRLDFAGGEGRFGKLVSEDGKGLDVAAHDAWEAGFFPDHTEPPSIPEFLDALAATHTGRNRVYRPEDFAEVDAFEAARRQRYDVEKAQLEGAPLVNDRGEPVDMADLDRNSPPVDAYVEWGENAPNLAGNIRLDKLDSPQAIKRALTQTENVTGGFDAARRGRITHAETENLAADLGMTADDLLKRRKGEAFNAEQALAARQILARSGTDLVNLARRIQRTDDPGDELAAAFSQAWLRHVAIQEQVSGMTAEAGRLLSQFRQVADSRNVDRVLPSLAQLTGGRDKVKEAADTIVDMEAAGKTPGEIGNFAGKALKPSWWSKLTELRMNFLLSGPQTHAVNILSNTLTALGQIPEHAIAAGFGGARQAFSRQPVDRVLATEVGARTVGLLQGFREGMERAAVTLRTGDTADIASKVEVRRQSAISGRKGEFIRLPSRLLSAEDELFKGIAQRMSLNGLAVRQAHAEGLRGQKAVERIAALTSNPPDAMLRQSIEYGRYLTYNQALPHNSLTSAIARAANADNAGGFAVKLVFPFQRTPVNILRFAAERSPLAPLLKPWRDDIAAGGARRDLALAKVMAGSGLMATTMTWAAQGHFTGGGPADQNAKRLMQADGWQPYSIRVGDRYYSYARLDPLATTLGVAADFAELQSHMTEKQRDKVAVLLATATANNLGNKVWFSGASDLVQAINDPERHWDAYARRMGASMVVPTVSAQVAKAVDPNLREARTMLDAIKARIPFASKSLQPRRNVWGNPLTPGGAVGPDLASPIWTSNRLNDPTNNALIDLGAPISPPQRSYTVNGKRTDWTPEQYGQLQQLTGSMAKPALDALIRDPAWPSLTPTDKRASVQRIMDGARASAKDQVRLGLFGRGVGPAPNANPWASDPIVQ